MNSTLFLDFQDHMENIEDGVQHIVSTQYLLAFNLIAIISESPCFQSSHLNLNMRVF